MVEKIVARTAYGNQAKEKGQGPSAEYREPKVPFFGRPNLEIDLYGLFYLM